MRIFHEPWYQHQHTLHTYFQAVWQNCFFATRTIAKKNTRQYKIHEGSLSNVFVFFFHIITSFNGVIISQFVPSILILITISHSLLDLSDEIPLWFNFREIGAVFNACSHNSAVICMLSIERSTVSTQELLGMQQPHCLPSNYANFVSNWSILGMTDISFTLWLSSVSWAGQGRGFALQKEANDLKFKKFRF